MGNARLLLQIDNTKLAHEDFKIKYISRRTLLSNRKYASGMYSVRAQACPLSRSCFSCRLDDEIKARKVLEKDVDNLRKIQEDTRLSCQQTQKEIDLVKEELVRLNQDHKNVSVAQGSRVEGTPWAETCTESHRGSPRRWITCARRSKTLR